MVQKRIKNSKFVKSPNSTRSVGKKKDFNIDVFIDSMKQLKKGMNNLKKQTVCIACHKPQSEWGPNCRGVEETTIKSEETKNPSPSTGWELRARRFGANKYQQDKFEAMCKAGKSIEYHFPDKVYMSRKRYEEIQKIKEKSVRETLEKVEKNFKKYIRINGRIKHLLIRLIIRSCRPEIEDIYRIIHS